MHCTQWRSMHAYATRDPIFLALNRKGIEETNGRLDQFCAVSCTHASAWVYGDRRRRELKCH